MKYWKTYEGHKVEIKGKRNKVDNTIYTFDIETTSYIVFHGKQYSPEFYETLSKKEQEECNFMSTMYIWQFSVNDIVYYGRTWEELEQFLIRLEFFGTDKKKIVFVHNLSYEFQFLRNKFRFSKVFARKSRKLIKCEMLDFNIEFRCSYMMTNVALERLPSIYQLPVKKLVGNLDYNIPRNSKTVLTEKELAYCENDCLVVYEYIKSERERYKKISKIPITATGHVRKEFKDSIYKNYKYLNKVRKCINTDGHIFNLMQDSFAGGYTHSNWTKTDEIIEDVTSYDFCSSYPFCMISEKYPSSEFRRCNIKSINQILDNFCYIVRVRFKNIRSKYYNNFISFSKCKRIVKGRYDNGRVIGAEELEIVLIDVDLKFIFQTYEIESYEFLEVYWAYKDYLPIEYIKFILDKYENKTKYKNVEGKEIEYALEKANFNSLYGMMVTQTITDTVEYRDDNGWNEIPLTNEEIENLLKKQKESAFLSFSWRYLCHRIRKIQFTF